MGKLGEVEKLVNKIDARRDIRVVLQLLQNVELSLHEHLLRVLKTEFGGAEVAAAVEVELVACNLDLPELPVLVFLRGVKHPLLLVQFFAHAQHHNEEEGVHGGVNRSEFGTHSVEKFECAQGGVNLQIKVQPQFVQSPVADLGPLLAAAS